MFLAFILQKLLKIIDKRSKYLCIKSKLNEIKLKALKFKDTNNINYCSLHEISK
jgi:hypothetical protein